MEGNNLVMNQDGLIANLNFVRTISELTTYETAYAFNLCYDGLKLDEANCRFIFYFKDYSDSKEELKIKVENIRLDIAKRLNGGHELKPVLSNIKLKK